MEATVSEGVVIENATELKKDSNLQMESLPVKIRKGNHPIATAREDFEVQR